MPQDTSTGWGSLAAVGAALANMSGLSGRKGCAIAVSFQCWLQAKGGSNWSMAIPCGHPLEEVETLSQLRFLSEHLTFCLAMTRT